MGLGGLHYSPEKLYKSIGIVGLFCAGVVSGVRYSIKTARPGSASAEPYRWAVKFCGAVDWTSNKIGNTIFIRTVANSTECATIT